MRPRLTRIGTPEAQANSSDWDQISLSFTAVRGAGYVAWYPIATEAADLSEGNSLFDVLGRWKAREASSNMEIGLQYPTLPGDAVQLRPCCVGGEELQVVIKGGSPQYAIDKMFVPAFESAAPAFVIANYKLNEQPGLVVYLSSRP